MTTNPYTPPEDSEGTVTEAAEAVAVAPLLSERIQRRNSLVFILNNSIGYLVAPVFYVGVLLPPRPQTCREVS